MNTRSFIKSLLVMAVAPSVIVPVLKDRFRWKLNPEWDDAPLKMQGTELFPRDYFGKWTFFYQQKNGVWVRESNGIKEVCFEPKYVYGGNPRLEWYGPCDEVQDMVFHRRENA